MHTYTFPKQVFVLPLGLILEQPPIFSILFSRDSSPISVTRTTVRGSFSVNGLNEDHHSGASDSNKVMNIPICPYFSSCGLLILVFFLYNKKHAHALECTQNIFCCCCYEMTQLHSTMQSMTKKGIVCLAYSFKTLLKSRIQPAKFPPPPKKPKNN